MLHACNTIVMSCLQRTKLINQSIPNIMWSGSRGCQMINAHKYEKLLQIIISTTAFRFMLFLVGSNQTPGVSTFLVSGCPLGNSPEGWSRSQSYVCKSLHVFSVHGYDSDHSIGIIEGAGSQLHVWSPGVTEISWKDIWFSWNICSRYNL